MEDAKKNVDQNSAVVQAGIARPDLIRSAAGGDIDQRLADIHADSTPDNTEIRINNAVRSRIMNAEGIWSDDAINHAEMLLDF